MRLNYSVPRLCKQALIVLWPHPERVESAPALLHPALHWGLC